MDIKLRARLSAYARVATFEVKPEDTDQGHVCNQMTPITPEQVDELFRNESGTPDAELTPVAPGASFIDSFFKE